MTASFDLSGRVAVVTGGTRGIGYAIAQAFIDHGAAVVVASRKSEACEAAADRLASGNGRAVGHPAHVGSPDDLDALVEVTLDSFGRIDILVNNAATSLDARLGDITPEIWAKSMDVNARGPLLLSQLAAPHLARGGVGSIINVVSMGAFTFNAAAPVYGAGKAALTSITRAMAQEYSTIGIRVNALSPGFVNTDMTNRADPTVLAEMASSTLMKRIAEPNEIGAPAVFLASDASSFMTGQVLVVDGGATPGR